MEQIGGYADHYSNMNNCTTCKQKDGLLPVLYYYSPNSAAFHKVKSLHYDKWLHEKLIPNLQSNSVTVSDQAPFHKVHTEKEPYSTSRKNDLIDSMNTKSYILMNAVNTVIQIHCNS
jgi:hypothetical protein